MFTQCISSPNAPKAIGPYSPCVKLGDFVYVSGQIPADPTTGNLVEPDIRKQTIKSLENVRALLAEMGLEMRHIVKTTIYMTDLGEFAAMNEEYAKFFNEPYPSRACVQVAALPKGAKVEIEAFAIDTLAYEAHAKASCGGGCCSGDTCDTCEGCAE